MIFFLFYKNSSKCFKDTKSPILFHAQNDIHIYHWACKSGIIIWLVFLCSINTSVTHQQGRIHHGLCKQSSDWLPVHSQIPLLRCMCVVSSLRVMAEHQFESMVGGHTLLVIHISILGILLRSIIIHTLIC